MPVGTANSTLKSSFSLTSLRCFTPTDNSDNGNSSHRSKNERLYNSLTKKSTKSNEQDKETWRKSWGSVISQDGKEFWEGFQADYDYLMAQNILEKTVSDSVGTETISGSIPTTPQVWSHSEFMDHFAQLYSWLKGNQDLVYGKEENVTDWKLRAERQEDMQRQRFRLDDFNDQSKKLIRKYPELECEVSWLAKHVNDKWETVEGMMVVSRKNEGKNRFEPGSRAAIEHEVKCLRRWLRELETKLKPLSFQRGWTKSELEMKAKEHAVLHRDIEAHRKIVSSVFKLCEKSDASTLLAVRALERKYHEYYLRSLEWQFHIESLVGLQLQNKNPPSWSNESDGEPVAKIARFACKKESPEYRKTGNGEGYLTKSKEDSSKETDLLAMDVVSSKISERFSGGSRSSSATIMDPDSGRDNDSILSEEDFSSKSLSLGAKSRNLDCFSGPKREEDSRSNFPAGYGKGSAGTGNQVQQVSNEANGENGDISRVREPQNSAGLTRPKTRPPNTGMFSWKHLDTDSDQEGSKMSKEPKTSNKEEETGTSSEESWTYEPGTTDKSDGVVRKKPNASGRSDTAETIENPKEMKYFSGRNIPKTGSGSAKPAKKEPISSINRKLVDMAEELFKCNVKSSYRAKKARLKMSREEDDGEKPLDSCDASGEYTEESDDDVSEGSDENDSSVATCRKSPISGEDVPKEFSTPKTSLQPFTRDRKPSSAAVVAAAEGANRLRSTSYVSLSANSCRGSSSLESRSSVSESALNQIFGRTDKSREFCLVPKNGWRLTEDGTWGSFGSSRRRKTKIRKKLNKRSKSGSEGVTLSGSDSPNISSPKKKSGSVSGLVKSGSFSGIIRKARDFSPAFTKCDSGTGTETDEEQNDLSPPRFRLGAKAGAVTVASGVETDKIQVEEQLSLNSDQAYWDNYQEKYQSEAYSEEPADSDTAKKLLEFGEDYGKFLGNQSDSTSPWNISANRNCRGKFDSDSDVDEVKRFLRQSVDQLDFVEMKLNENTGSFLSGKNVADEESLSKTFLDEIIATCRKNVDGLTQLLSEINDEMHIPKEQNYIKNVKDSWEDLKNTAEIHKSKQLRSDMTALKNELLNWAAAIESMETTVSSREELEARIIQIKNELNAMKKGKSKLLQANVSVHRFLSTAKHGEPSLRDEVTELYRVWDQTFCRVSSQLFNLESLSQAWHDFDDHLSQLQCALRTDTLKIIDFALQCGTSSSDVTGSLRDIAGLLTDQKEITANDSVSTSQESIAVANPRPLLILSTEGSLSDSGISDSGSEQELSEREKRLAQLKRLAKRLESILAPSSQALSNMFKRIDEAENGLRELQKTCRELIVRTSSSEEFKMIVSDKTGSRNETSGGCPVPNSSAGCRKRIGGKGLANVCESPKEEAEDDKKEEEKSKPGRKSWLWRLLRFALPLQLALAALLCVACIMEPRCCDSLNNLDMSLSPQLRYDSGPPPV